MINLLPPEIKESRKYASRNLAMIKACVFLGASIAVIGGMRGYGYIYLNRAAKEVTQASQAKQAELKDLDVLQKNAQGIADTIKTGSILLGREKKFSELIQTIGSLMPEGATLKGLRLTGDTKQPLEITANIKSIDLAPVLQRNLLTSDLFEAADIQSVQRQQVLNDQGVVISENPETTLLVSFKQLTTTTKSADKPKLPENFTP
jgi:Tfp pilus assembly protein PilN